MPSQGYTVIPDIQVNEATGEEIINVMNASVIGDNNKQAIRDDVQRQAQDSFQVNERGDLESTMDFNEQDATNLLESVGGETAYMQALRWAGENLSSEDIDAYDLKMQSGNIAEVHDYMQQLMQRYSEAQTDSTTYADFESYFFSEIVTEEEFPAVQQFIRENMNADFIDRTNTALDEGNYDEYEALMKEAITMMVNGQ